MASLSASDASVQLRGDRAVRPFILNVSQDRVDDLVERLSRARLPEAETVDDWSQGIPLSTLEALRRYWLEDHDWRRLESELNGLGQWQTDIDGLAIHFLHVRSARADARPLLITHGWPGSIVESLDVVSALIDPPADQPAFHLVLPSLPGFGFSGKPSETGWGLERVADAWAELMSRLGYNRFLAQGGDWGAMVTATLALRHPARLLMMHTTVPWAPRPAEADDATLTPLERSWIADHQRFRERGAAYAALKATRPQTLGYALVDSPVGQLAWLADFLIRHSDVDDDGVSLVTRARLIDNVAIYWFGASGASSARLYWESLGKMEMKTPITVPCAVSVFPKELMKLPRAWVEARFKDLRYWSVLDRGGHFASLEEPEVFVSQLRQAFAKADQA
jgi:pimeloyl-ACP methyl ester carboxylesterase